MPSSPGVSCSSFYFKSTQKPSSGLRPRWRLLFCLSCWAPLSFPSRNGWILVGMSVVELLVGLESQVVTVWVLKHLFGACACHRNEYFFFALLRSLVVFWPGPGAGTGTDRFTGTCWGRRLPSVVPKPVPSHHPFEGKRCQDFFTPLLPVGSRLLQSLLGAETCFEERGLTSRVGLVLSPRFGDSWCRGVT